MSELRDRLLDRFAAAALSGILANASPNCRKAAIKAYEYADAMLAERSERFLAEAAAVKARIASEMNKPTGPGPHVR
jgi:hypothetical protein